MAHLQVGSIIHLGARIEYAVTSAEIQQLASGGNTAWKDTCLVAATALVSSISNAVAALPAQGSQPSLTVFLNALIAGIALFAAMASGIAWRKTVLSRRELVQEILARPGFLLRAESLEPETISAFHVEGGERPPRHLPRRQPHQLPKLGTRHDDP